MKIENSGKSFAPTAASEAKPRSPANATARTEAAADKVELSPLSAMLKKAEGAMASTPVVDQQRVAEIRQAIAEGRFTVDTGRVADGLIASVREMLGSRG